jgi:transcriptional regulator with XRE-family HTH domain
VVQKSAVRKIALTVAKLAKQFGLLIRKRRQAAGISQEALADRARLHRTYISLLERGLRMPSILVVQQLAKALDTTMTSLIAELERG